jgi:hypothetical protein
MQLLHEEAYRSRIISRIEALRPDTPRRWGKMSADQMLWHVNGGLSMALGHIDVAPPKPPLPRRLMRWLVLNLPWPKSAPTLPPFVANGAYDFDAERTRCFRLSSSLSPNRSTMTGPRIRRSDGCPDAKPAACKQSTWIIISGSLAFERGACNYHEGLSAFTKPTNPFEVFVSFVLGARRALRGFQLVAVAL